MKTRNRNKSRRLERQAQAKERQAAYDRLSLKEKLSCLPAGPSRQRVRLEKLTAKEASP